MVVFAVELVGLALGRVNISHLRFGTYIALDRIVKLLLVFVLHAEGRFERMKSPF